MEPQITQRDAVIIRLGGWLFRHRSWLPAPLALTLLLWPGARITTLAAAFGFLIVAAGEALRLWGVHHIGVISRTRSERLGPLVSSGPFAFVRNPLYLGNIALWAGFAVAASGTWAAPATVVALLAFEYHAIVRWEEGLLDSRLGERYRDYARRVPRWLPRLRPAPLNTASETSQPFAWRDTLFSERGTLLAMAVGLLLLWFKASL